jgi:hypothetical protein
MPKANRKRAERSKIVGPFDEALLAISSFVESPTVIETPTVILALVANMVIFSNFVCN